jgi:hypothetical protein
VAAQRKTNCFIPTISDPSLADVAKKSEKALANYPINDKRKLNNSYRSVPKKTKTGQDKNQPSAESDGPSMTKKTGKRRSGQRATAAKKPRGTVTKDLPDRRAQVSALPSTEPSTSGEPSEELIRLRAYFISERRRRFALPGDAESDWLEAKRQLLSEARH